MTFLLFIGRKKKLFLTISGVMIPLILYILFAEGISAFAFQTYRHLENFDKNGVLLQTEGEPDLSGVMSALEKSEIPFSYTLLKDTDRILQKKGTYRGRPLCLNMNIKILSGSISNGFLPYEIADTIYADRIRFTQTGSMPEQADSLIPCILEQSTALLLFGEGPCTEKLFTFQEDDRHDHTFLVCGVIEDLPGTASNILQLNKDALTGSSPEPVSFPCGLYILHTPEDPSAPIASLTERYPVRNSCCFFLFTEDTFSKASAILQHTDLHAGYSCLYDQRSLAQQTEEFISSVESLGIPVLLILAVISGLLIMNTMYFSIQERTHEIGTRRAAGAGIRQILFQFLLEGFCIGMVSALGACILSLLLLFLLNLFLVWNAGMDLVLTLHLKTILSVFVFSLVQTQLFSFLPARHAARLQPSRALLE